MTSARPRTAPRASLRRALPSLALPLALTAYVGCVGGDGGPQDAAEDSSATHPHPDAAADGSTDHAAPDAGEPDAAADATSDVATSLDASDPADASARDAGRDAAHDARGSSDGGVDSGSDATGGPTPLIFQDFTPTWADTMSPDGIWRIAGVWTGTGGNVLDPANAQVVGSYGGETGGFLLLTSRANVLQGGEIQTLPTYSYGYYETRMKVASVSGVCDSFFWIEQDYGSHEIDIEFLTNESWIDSASSGQVHLTLHPSEQAYILHLPFNPSRAFHRYGFLWRSGHLDFTVDGAVAHSFDDADLATPVPGYIMMNTWTGAPDWGGGPPTADATTAYDWVKFYPGATAVVP